MTTSRRKCLRPRTAATSSSLRARCARVFLCARARALALLVFFCCPALAPHVFPLHALTFLSSLLLHMAAATYDCLPAPCPHLACTGESGDAGITRAQALTLQARGASARRISAQELAQGAFAPVGLGARGLPYLYVVRAALGGLKCTGMGVLEQGIRVTRVSACIRRDEYIFGPLDRRGGIRCEGKCLL